MFAVVISFFAAGFAIAMSGLALIVVAFLPSMEFFYIPAFNHFAMFFGGIGFISLGILFCIGTWYIGKGFSILTIKYIKLNIRIISGEKKWGLLE